MAKYIKGNSPCQIKFTKRIISQRTWGANEIEDSVPQDYLRYSERKKTNNYRSHRHSHKPSDCILREARELPLKLKLQQLILLHCQCTEDERIVKNLKNKENVGQIIARIHIYQMFNCFTYVRCYLTFNTT